MKHNPLDEVRSSLVLFILLGVMIVVLPLLITLVPVGSEGASAGHDLTVDNLLSVASYLIIGGLLWAFSRDYREEMVELLLNIPDPAARRGYLWLSVGLVISSVGFTYLMFYPLSLVAPEFVERWLDVPYLLYWDEQGSYWLGNLAGIVAAVLLAPVVEEFIFRGYLLNRWTGRMGAALATLLSAFLFALLHIDMLGAFVFAIMMSLIYMKTRSLVAPILVHMANNAIAVTLEWLDRSYWSGFEVMTLDDFYEYAWLGIVCMLIGFPWLWFYTRRNFFPLRTLLSEHEQGQSNDYLA